MNMGTQLSTLPQRFCAMEQELQAEGMKVEEITRELNHWKSRCDTALSEVEQLKEEKFSLQVELQTAGQQLSQQVEFSSCMGAACGTLLWRVSRCEESIQAILIGTKVDEFLMVVGSTLESYIKTYQTDVPQETADETQFILALCGVVANIAASPFGREFLMDNEQGRCLVESFVTILADTPSKQCTKVKTLILMALYNLSINQKGIKLIVSKTNIVSLLARLVQEESVTENRLFALRLIQSLLYEQDSSALLSEANISLTPKLLKDLIADPNHDIRQTALELGTNLRSQYIKQLPWPDHLEIVDGLCKEVTPPMTCIVGAHDDHCEH